MDIMGRIPAGTEKEPASLSLWFLIRIALKATIILTFLLFQILKLYNLEVVTLSVDSPRPRHRADPAQSSAFFLVPKAYIPPSAESADTRCGRSVYPLPAP